MKRKVKVPVRATNGWISLGGRTGMRTLAILSVFLASFATAAHADRTGDQGVGLMLGVPSGFTWKMFLSNEIALDADLGVSHSALDTNIDLLWHNYQFAKNLGGLEPILRQGELPVYIGLGPRILFEDKSEFGLRIPLGVAFLPNNSEWEFFAEFAPIIRFTPDTGFNGHYLVGARYYFPAVRPRDGGSR